MEAFGVRTDPGTTTDVKWYDAGDVIFTYSNGEKVRPNPTKQHKEGKPRFSFTSGRRPHLFKRPNTGERTSIAFLVEGETDAMRLWQEMSGASDVFGLSGIDTWQTEFVDELKEYDAVFTILDNDTDYLVAAQVERVAQQIRIDLKPKYKRLRLPNTVKDVCEFFDNYDLDALRLLANRHMSESRYKSLDLRQPPPPPKWLVEGLVSLGDVTMVPGWPGLGKSWLTMGLTIAVAEGWPSLLDRQVHRQGRVLYLDEENPEDVVYTRLHKLGLTPVGIQNIRYLWNQGIRLDRDPDMFLEEAMEFEPTLIVIDSLSQVHLQDENNNGAMSALFKLGIQPLARETDAAVLLIHHTNKQNGQRGAIANEASVDNMLHMDGAGDDNPGKFILRQGKSRRKRKGDELVVEIKDQSDGSVALEANVAINPPF